jgi:8-oxo-dGTP pyrophosphatase MutT (NUDIX family)
MMTEDFNDSLAEPISAERGDAPDGYIEQAGALCLRERKGRAEVLLIRGRRNGKWGIPKGGIEVGETSAEAAAREAYEEAGVSGQCEETAVASFRYQKQGKGAPYRVSVHRMDVKNTSTDFPEAGQRNPLWVDCDDAADLVEEDGLREILRSLGR